MERQYLFRQGDLRQLSDQMSFLRANGFCVRQSDVFPVVETKEEYIKGLKAFYDGYVNGWWNYEEECVTHGICTKAEFQERFRAYMAKERK